MILLYRLVTRFAAVLALPALVLVTSCSDDASSGGSDYFDVVDARYDTNGDTGQDAGLDEGDASAPCIVAPAPADSDQDGLSDVVEDADRDCIVDEDETDPFNPDTDGDSLPDGVEDIDRNGVWNASRGETDPRRKDSDEDGLSDAEELYSLACRSTQTRDLLNQRVLLSDGSALFIPGAYQELTQPLGNMVAIRSETRERGRFGVFLRDAPALASLQDLVDTFAQAPPDGMDVSWIGERATDDNQWLARFTVASEELIDVQDLLGFVLAAFNPQSGEESIDIGETWDESSIRFRNADVQVAFMPRGGGSEVAVAMSTQTGDEDWFRRIHPRALSPGPDTRLRVQCAEVKAANDETARLVIIVPSIIQDDGPLSESLIVIEQLLEAGVLPAIDLRILGSSGADMAEQVDITSANAFRSVLETLIVDELDAPMAVPVASEIRAVAREVEGGGRTVILALAAGDSSEVIAISDDTSGAPSVASREELITSTVEAFEAADAELVVIGPTNVGSAMDCDSGSPSIQDAQPSVYLDLVRSTGATLANPCLVGARAVLGGQILELLYAREIGGIARSPIWGSGTITTWEEDTFSAQFNQRGGGYVVFSEASISGVDAGLSFTYWERPSNAE